jgi:hypothetical protein
LGSAFVLRLHRHGHEPHTGRSLRRHPLEIKDTSSDNTRYRRFNPCYISDNARIEHPYPEMSLRRSFHLFLPHRLAFASKQPHEGVDVVNAEKQKRASAGELNRSTP